MQADGLHGPPPDADLIRTTRHCDGGGMALTFQASRLWVKIGERGTEF